MHTSTKRTNRGLDANAPERGIGRDAYEVAQTAVMLHGQRREPYPIACARHAVTLHRLSGLLHRYAERLCNEDLTCPRCQGDGLVMENGNARRVCPDCAEHGNTLGHRIERARQDAREIAAHYGLLAYFQTDPRGCALYLIDPATLPDRDAMERDYRYPSDSAPPLPVATLQARWLDANYNLGHAVVRMGR